MQFTGPNPANRPAFAPAKDEPSHQYRTNSYTSDRLPGIHDLDLPRGESTRPPMPRHSSAMSVPDAVGPDGAHTPRRSPPAGEPWRSPSQAHAGRPSHDAMRSVFSPQNHGDQRPSPPSIQTRPNRPPSSYATAPQPQLQQQLQLQQPYHYNRQESVNQSMGPRPSSTYHESPQQYHQSQQAPAAQQLQAFGVRPNHRRADSSSMRSGERPAIPVSQYTTSGGLEYYGYNDGTSVPTAVDGQLVNPHYGITKQGNPRKRGSHACLTCRSKKVKCEMNTENPDGPCRACHRGGHDCNWSEPANDRFSPDGMSEPGTPGHDKRRYTSGSEVSDARKQSNNHMSASDDINHRNKRLKLEPRPSERMSHANGNNGVVTIGYCSTVDPALLSHKIMTQLLDLYFAYRDCQCTTVLPRKAFMQWAVDCRNKRPQDLMLVYACMALGSVFTGDHDQLRSFGNEALDTAKQLEASLHGQFTLQLALTRLHLALYFWAKNTPLAAFEYTASACRALGALGFNTEDRLRAAVQEPPDRNDFWLPGDQLVECRRRTFWLGYCTERYLGHSSGSSILLPDDDIFVRLPGDNESFLEGTPSPGEPFDEGNFDISKSGQGIMSAWISMVAIWGRVTANIFRTVHRTHNGDYTEKFERFYTDINHRIEGWKAALPLEYQYSTANTTKHLNSNTTFSAYYVIQSVYHATLIKLNRHFRFPLVPPAIVARNIKGAYDAATEHLELITAISRVLPLKDEDHGLDNALSQPFPAYCTLIACDTVSCGGSQANLRDVHINIINAVAVLDVHKRYTTSAERQRNLVHQRMADLGGWKRMLHDAQLPESRSMFQDANGTAWDFGKAIETIYHTGYDIDVIYGVDKHTYWAAVRQ